MKSIAVALTIAVSALLVAPSLARADDPVHTCIAASTHGQTLRQAGHLLDARDQMIACARDACPAVVRSHCARWLGELDNRIPSVVVRAQDPGGADLVDARVLIDGKPSRLDGRAVQLDPGEHVIGVQSSAGRKEERVILVEGESSRLVMLRVGPPEGQTRASAPSPSPSPSPPPMGSSTPEVRQTRIPVGAWVLGAAGIASLGVATYFGLAANAQLNDLKTCSPHCADAQTQPGRHDALAFDVLLGVGGAALGAALVWALALPSSVEIQPVSRGALGTLVLRY